MAHIATVTLSELKGKLFKKFDYSYSDISGVEILNVKIKSQKYRRRILKMLSKNNVKYVVSNDCEGISNTNGTELLKRIYPLIVKRFSKTYKKSDSVLICADRLDDTAKDIIYMLCDDFKYISVATSDYNKDKFFDEVFLEKGVLLLPPSENANEPVLYLSGKKTKSRKIFDITDASAIKIYTPCKKVISPALCEAVIKAKCGENCDMKAEFLRLKYKVI